LLQFRLHERFPDAQVFMDLDSNEAGLDFAEVIRDAVGSCAVLVSLIGSQLLDLIQRVLAAVRDQAEPDRRAQQEAEWRAADERARSAGQAGDAAGAQDQYAALALGCERDFGPEHPNTLAARASLARWAGAAGDAAGARDQCAALLSIEGRVLGPEHPATLATRASLARWAGAAGDAAGARDQCAALLPILERVLGPEHPDSLATSASLAYWTEHSGR
jgi:Tetratricopeptide repeat